MPPRLSLRVALPLALIASLTRPAAAQSDVFGRWDLTAASSTERWPLWFELRVGLSGRFQPRGGHALPIVGANVQGKAVTFPVPGEEAVTAGQQFTATISGDSISGEIKDRLGGRITITGKRAPSLARSHSPEWAGPIDLLAKGLSSWHPRTPGAKNAWAYLEGELQNTGPGTDLVTNATFTDFTLHLEVNVPTGGNSGIYLRGRYEVQVQDDYGKAPGNVLMGAIYGHIQPMSLPARPAGQWQTFDITLIGRRVTVVLNKVTIIDNQEIPGITGGALDSDEGAPGPLMLQGDHTAMKYRNIRITPAK
jgi:hypothetical protein